MRYLVVGRHPWNHQHFLQFIGPKSSSWEYCGSSEQFSAIWEGNNDFRYVFFLHWSEIVPHEVIKRWECVCFHMTDVPYGRGGSPLQNLISIGHRETKLTALRMTEELDAGPVYLKAPLSLEGSTAEEIYMRASKLSCEMAIVIARDEMEPQLQQGEATVFKRRTKAQSLLPVESNDLLKIHDHIRMLDANGYPKAFLEIGNYRLEFSRAALYQDGVQADVTITSSDAQSNNEENE